MPLNTILVDFENVGDFDLAQLKRDNVNVIVFVGSNQAKIPTDLVMRVQALEGRARFVRISGNGPNALDFHIAFTMGELCSDGQAHFFHIISKDQGFDPLIAYMKTRKIAAGRYATISEIPFLISTPPAITSSRVQTMIEYFSDGKHTRPRTPTTLTNLVKSKLGKDLTAEDLQAVINSLASRKILKIENGKVTYLALTQKPSPRPASVSPPPGSP